MAANFNTSVNHTFVGTLAGSGATGGEPTCIGYRACADNTGDYNTAVGAWAGDTSEGELNTFVGYSAGYESVGTNNLFIGYYAGLGNTGDYNVGIGEEALEDNTGDACIGIGYNALFQNTGNNVVAIGDSAGMDNATANQFIIKQASVNATPLIQGDFSTGNVGIGVIDPHSKLEVNGAISSATATLTASSDNYDVSGINALFINPASANVVLGGLTGGVAGQVLHVTITGIAFTTTIENQEGVGDQDIYLCDESDDTLDDYGGWVLVCDGSNWYDCGHAKHV
ncbi:hypothetical protein ES703_119638 [subsurface metagenome]